MLGLVLHPVIWRLVRVASITLVGCLIVVAVLLLCLQHRLIYHPPRHEPGRLPACPGAVAISAMTGQGRQFAYWIPPRAGHADSPVWLVFGGNAASALGWSDLVAAHPDPRAGFLLIDYPGYGANDGAPSPAAILAATEAEVTALAMHLRQSPERMQARLRVLGHSLGAANALHYASRHRVGRIVLIAPFTRMLDMARGSVGWPFHHLLLHRYDNRMRLAEIMAAGAPPIAIIHGSDDEVVPVAMGRDLARTPGMAIAWMEVPGAMHDDVIDVARTLIYEAMAER